MSVLDVFTLGESSRIDYVVREHDELAKRFAALADLLVAKKILTREEIDALTPAEPSA